PRFAASANEQSLKFRRWQPAFRPPPRALSHARTKTIMPPNRRPGVFSMREIGHFIGGKQVSGTSGRSGDVFNPNTGEVQAKVAFARKAEVEQAIANAEAAQPAWAATNPQRRA